MAEHVGRDADVRCPTEETVDLLAPGRQRHRPVQHCDPVRVQPVDLTREREHGLAAEGDHDRAPGQGAQLSRPDELERELALVDAELGVRERAANEGQRVERAEQPHVAVLAGEKKLRPGGAAPVVGPLHLVEHQHVARPGAISTV